jgi:hypothetical protein
MTSVRTREATVPGCWKYHRRLTRPKTSILISVFIASINVMPLPTPLTSIHRIAELPAVRPGDHCPRGPLGPRRPYPGGPSGPLLRQGLALGDQEPGGPDWTGAQRFPVDPPRSPPNQARWFNDETLGPPLGEESKYLSSLVPLIATSFWFLKALVLTTERSFET